MGYIGSHVKKANDFTRKTIDQDIKGLKWLFVYIDLLFSIVFYGVNLSEYFQYRFYFKRHACRKSFMVYRKRMKLIKKYNGPHRKIFDDKAVFCALFSDYTGRDFIDAELCGFEAFSAFIKKHGRFFVKPKQGFYGIGSGLYETGENEDIPGLYEKLKSEKMLAEELIVQCDGMAAFNPASVNTLRVVTFKSPDGTVHITSAVLRMGTKESAADNFHNDGLAALIDIETGIVYTKGYNRYLESFIVHPATKKEITGFAVPYWEDVKRIVYGAACVVEEVRYVGWDIAIGREGKIYIVEGNAAADPDVVQIPNDTGIWPVYKKLMKSYSQII